MLKWLVTLLALVVLIGLLQPVLARRWRLGRLPGDFVLRIRGRPVHVPFMSTVLLSWLMWLLMRLF